MTNENKTLDGMFECKEATHMESEHCFKGSLRGAEILCGCCKKSVLDVVKEAYEKGAKDEQEKILNGKISDDVVSDADFIEALSALEHTQWEHWSKELSKRMEKACQENNGLIAFSMEMKQRWMPNWKPYEELPENVKEHDRKWAKLAASICNRGYSFCYEKGKQAGQIAAGDLCAKNLCGGFQRGRDEGMKKECEYNLDGCHSCSKVKEKIAALEAEIKTKNDTIDELIKPCNKYVKENARLRGCLEKMSCKCGKTLKTGREAERMVCMRCRALEAGK